MNVGVQVSNCPPETYCKGKSLSDIDWGAELELDDDKNIHEEIEEWNIRVADEYCESLQDVMNGKDVGYIRIHFFIEDRNALRNKDLLKYSTALSAENFPNGTQEEPFQIKSCKNRPQSKRNTCHPLSFSYALRLLDPEEIPMTGGEKLRKNIRRFKEVRLKAKKFIVRHNKTIESVISRGKMIWSVVKPALEVLPGVGSAFGILDQVYNLIFNVYVDDGETAELILGGTS